MCPKENEEGLLIIRDLRCEASDSGPLAGEEDWCPET